MEAPEACSLIHPLNFLNLFRAYNVQAQATSRARAHVLQTWTDSTASRAQRRNLQVPVEELITPEALGLGLAK